LRACGLVGVGCRPHRGQDILVARRRSVAILDESIGPQS
jgi:hypothetical protein